MTPDRQQRRAHNQAAHNARHLHEHAKALRQIEAPGLRYKLIAAQLERLAEDLETNDISAPGRFPTD